MNNKECIICKDLSETLQEAYDQAVSGKGNVRHNYGEENFSDQLICEIARRLYPCAYSGPLYQSVKKIYESTRLSPGAAIRELQGAINYIAAAILLIKEEQKKCTSKQN